MKGNCSCRSVGQIESQRDSVPKPELPWEKRVVSANPNGVVARWWSEDTTPLGLRIARTLTQGSLADFRRGGGSVLAPGVQRQKNSLGPPLPSPLLPRGRRGRSRRASRGNFLNSTAVHPGPLPRGEGATLAALRACGCARYARVGLGLSLSSGERAGVRGNGAHAVSSEPGILRHPPDQVPIPGGIGPEVCPTPEPLQ